MQLSFCQTCGRITLRGFVYCPYCGMALRPGPDIDRASNGAFERMSEMQAELRDRRIDEMISALDGLASEVDEIMHGAASTS